MCPHHNQLSGTTTKKALCDRPTTDGEKERMHIYLPKNLARELRNQAQDECGTTNQGNPRVSQYLQERLPFLLADDGMRRETVLALLEHLDYHSPNPEVRNAVETLEEAVIQYEVDL